MNATTDTTAIGILFLSALLAFLTTWFWTYARDRKEERAKLVEDRERVQSRLGEVEGKLQVMEQAIVPISTAFQAILIEKLTHYHTPAMDKLLVKLGADMLAPAEEKKLFAALKRRTRDMNGRIDRAERNAAIMLPMVMEMVKEEALVDPATLTKQVVGLPVESEAEK